MGKQNPIYSLHSLTNEEPSPSLHSHSLSLSPSYAPSPSSSLLLFLSLSTYFFLSFPFNYFLFWYFLSISSMYFSLFSFVAFLFLFSLFLSLSFERIFHPLSFACLSLHYTFLFSFHSLQFSSFPYFSSLSLFATYSLFYALSERERERKKERRVSIHSLYAFSVFHSLHFPSLFCRFFFHSLPSDILCYFSLISFASLSSFLFPLSLHHPSHFLSTSFSLQASHPLFHHHFFLSPAAFLYHVSSFFASFLSSFHPPTFLSASLPIFSLPTFLSFQKAFSSIRSSTAIHCKLWIEKKERKKEKPFFFLLSKLSFPFVLILPSIFLLILSHPHLFFFPLLLFLSFHSFFSLLPFTHYFPFFPPHTYLSPPFILFSALRWTHHEERKRGRERRHWLAESRTHLKRGWDNGEWWKKRSW